MTATWFSHLKSSKFDSLKTTYQKGLWVHKDSYSQKLPKFWDLIPKNQPNFGITRSHRLTSPKSAEPLWHKHCPSFETHNDLKLKIILYCKKTETTASSSDIVHCQEKDRYLDFFNSVFSVWKSWFALRKPRCFGYEKGSHIATPHLVHLSAC